jgi:23S rRNA (cytosine1962-C5)-methyltransferase
VDAGTFFESVAGGLWDARRSARLIDEYRQASDHPIVLHLPETFYLKGFLLEMMPGR